MQCHYIDTDAFVLSIVSKDIIKGMKNLEDMCNFSNLDEKHELFSNKKLIGKFKLETPKNIWIDKFVCLRSKINSLKCDPSKNKFQVFLNLNQNILNLKSIKDV